MNAASLLTRPDEQRARQLPSSTRSPLLWAILFGLLALALRLYGAGQIPVAGDELNSLSEAGDLTRNLHGILYFGLLRLWMLGGTGPLWLRLPGIVIGAAGAPLMYAWLRSWRGEAVARVAALLFALSPFAVEYSREIRYYPLYLTFSVVAFWAYTRWERTPSGKNLAKWWGANLLLAGSHFLGALAMGLQLLDHALWDRKWKWRHFPLAACAALVAVVGAVVLFPPVRDFGWRVFARATAVVGGANAAYAGPRGLSVVSVAKTGLLFIFFATGQFLPPFDLALSLPVVLLFYSAGALGLYRLGPLPKRALTRLLVFAALTILAVFYFMDSVLPANHSASAAPKYVIFLLPLLLWTLAEGCVRIAAELRLPRVVRVVWLFAILAAQLTGLYCLYHPTWAYYEYKAQNWAAAVGLARQSPRVLTAGQSGDILSYYLKPLGMTGRIENAWALAQPANNGQGQPLGSDPLVVVTSSGRTETSHSVEPLLKRLAQEGFHPTAALVDWPLFVYGYDPSVGLALEGGARALDLPRTFYDIRFADLNLPRSIVWRGLELPLLGAWRLPDWSDENQVDVGISETESGPRSLLLVSTATDMPASGVGSTIGEIVLTTAEGQVTVPVRLGVETASWDSDGAQSCSSVLSWHKRFALVGESGYPDAYRDFTAHLFAAEIPLPADRVVTNISFRLQSQDGQWYLWGLYLIKP